MIRAVTQRLDFKIVLAIFVCAALSFGMVTFLDILHQTRSLLDREKEHLLSTGMLLRRYIETSMLNQQRQNISFAIQALKNEGSSPFEEIQVLDDAGRVRIASDKEKVGASVSIRKSPEQIGRHFFFTLPVPAKPACLRCHGNQKPILGYIAFTTSLQSVYRKILRTQAEHFWVMSSTLALLCILIFLILHRFVSLPVRQIIAGMERVKEEDFQSRLSDKIPGELGEMAHSFNAMTVRLEEARREIESLHQQRMSQVDRLASLGELSAGLAHEIRNALTAVDSAIRVIRKETLPPDPHAGVLDQIIKKITSLSRAVNSLLDYARLPEPVLKTASLPALLDRVLDFTRHQTAGQGIEVKKEFAPELPGIVLDEGQIEQTFLNLVLNATQAMPQGGTLTLRIRHRPGDRLVEVDVQDSGGGIAPEHRPRLFEPFFTTRPKGNGLGLAVAKRILEMHNGRIEVESEPGRGSLFRVCLPVRLEVGENV